MFYNKTLMNTVWDKHSIIGQAPMDGVTDAAFRYITDIHGEPDVLFTEFIPVEGIARKAVKILHSFVHHPTKTPTLAQIYGRELEAFYLSAFVAAELGFDGIDINMGCPDRAVTRRGAGAGLIKSPKHAVKIINTVKQAVQDWCAGKTMEEAHVPAEIIDHVTFLQEKHQTKGDRIQIPVSVKTRIGYDKIVTEEWIKNLTDANPAAISLHGRTLEQMYTGKADWEEIGKAAEVAHAAKIKLLGNGDVRSMPEAREKIEKFHLDGVLIGRATFGNPWLFQEIEPDTHLRINTALEHAEAFEKLLPDGHFVSLRKHMAWYMKGFDHAAALRDKLMRMQNISDVREIISPYLLVE